jgi:pantoate--beta-alanine ligase
MKVLRTIREYKDYIAPVRKSGQTVGFVPTMGYLHEGHLSLVARAKEETDHVVMSIFVNPLQFGPNEDFERYPRDEARDLRMAEDAGVDAVFLPSVEEMYPSRMKTVVSVSELTDRLCGASRPGHFAGVTTVVSKLFHIILPDRAFFGMKDAQQVAVIEQMVHDLNFPLTVVPCPIIRESDGLAKSSRNVYLTPEQREQAPILNRALESIEEWLEETPELTARQLEEHLKNRIESAPLAVIDYVQIFTFPALEEVHGPVKQAGKVIAALAVKFGNTRLIDNKLLD